MGTRSFAVAACLAVLLGAGPVSAGVEEGKGLLALVAAPGKAVPFVLTIEREGEEEGGLNARMRAAGVAVPEDRMRTVEERSVEILGPEDGEGRTGSRAVIRFGRITAHRVDFFGKPREVRSDAKAPEGIILTPDALEAVAPGGAELGVILDPGGVPRSVEVPPGLEAERVKAMGLDANARSFVGIHLHGSTLLPRLNHPLTGAPLPAAAVGAGDSWEAEDVLLEGVTGTRMALLQTLRVEAVDAAEVRLAGKGRVEARIPDVPLKGKEAQKKLKELLGDPPEVKKSSASTKLRLSRADGLPLAGSGEASWELMGKAPGSKEKTKTRVKVRWTLERVEAWPSGLPAGGKKAVTPQPTGK